MNEDIEIKVLFQVHFWDKQVGAEDPCAFDDKSEVFNRDDLLEAFKAGRESV